MISEKSSKSSKVGSRVGSGKSRKNFGDVSKIENFPPIKMILTSNSSISGVNKG